MTSGVDDLWGSLSSPEDKLPQRSLAHPSGRTSVLPARKRMIVSLGKME